MYLFIFIVFSGRREKARKVMDLSRPERDLSEEEEDDQPPTHKKQPHTIMSYDLYIDYKGQPIFSHIIMQL